MPLQTAAIPKSLGDLTHREIFQQPELWATSVERVRHYKPDFTADAPVVVTGAGTSAYAASAVAASWPGARAIPTTDLLLAERPPVGSCGLLVSLARSGDSPESAGVVERIQRLFPCVKHLAITCNGQGRLARTPGVEALVLDPRTNDGSLAMTSSFSNLVLAGMCLRRRSEVEPFLDAICLRAEKALPELEALANRIARPRLTRVVVLGSGALYPAAREGALKILEMTAGQVAAMAETFLGLRHGPMSFLRADSLVLCLLSSDPRRLAYERDLIAELRAKKLGRIIAIASDESVDGSLCEERILPNAPELPDDLRTPFEILFPQLLAYHLSLQCWLDPDNPSPDGVITRVVQGVRVLEM